jgi:hypothetical protein
MTQAGICVTISMTLLWLAQWYQWRRCDIYSRVNDTTVQIWHHCDFGTHNRVALATFKGNIYRRNMH